MIIIQMREKSNHFEPGRQFAYAQAPLAQN